MTFAIVIGDVREIATVLDAESFDGCLCDPPYGLSFMGKKWDYDVPSVETWAAVLAALKPGAHLLAFAGTRTQHRMAVRIEDAGFEIRDMIAWVYGSGFPKSLDVSKAIDKAAGLTRERVPHPRGKGFGDGVASTYANDAWTTANAGTRSDKRPLTDAAGPWQGYGTALKPALEPITLARKPLRGTVAATALAYGTGPLNVDGCRIEGQPWSREGMDDLRGGAYAATLRRPTIEGARESHALGRWPANLIHDGSEEVLAGFPEATSGARSAGVRTGLGFSGKAHGDGGPEIMASTGSAARFFYCAKASRSEREAGLETTTRRTRAVESGHSTICGKCNRQRVNMPGSSCTCAEPEWVRSAQLPVANHHPTVKPIALAEYLARLILPPKRDTPRRLLVPFCGSGSEIIGALRAGWDEVVGIELSPEYAEIAKARIAADQDGAQMVLA